MKTTLSRLKIILCMFLFSVIVLALSCNHSENDTNTNEIEVQFKIIEEGIIYSSAGYEDKYIEAPMLLKLDTESAFHNFWEDYPEFSSTAPPPIDFEKDIVLVLLDIIEGSISYAIETKRLIDDGENIRVRGIKTLYIGSGCSGDDAMNQPFSMIQTKRSEKSFVLLLKETTKACD